MWLFFADPLNKYYNMVHYNCFLGFLSLLTHKCQIIFNWRLHYPSCIISLLKTRKKITECPHETPEGHCWFTYNNLFLHDYKTPSEINPFDTTLSRQPIPRSVIEYHHLHIIPPLIVRREQAHNQGENTKKFLSQ